MRTLLKTIFLSVAALAVIVSSARAQSITYTTETLSKWGGSTFNFYAGLPMGETFSGITRINELTYAFVSSASASGVASGSLNYTFAEWNTDTGSIKSILTSGSLAVSNSNFTQQLAGSYVNTTDGNFNLSAYALDSAKTYALIFSSTTGQNFGLGWMLGNSYSLGGTVPTMMPGTDYAFAYISVEVPTSAVPVPESSTVASILGCTMAAGLVSFRVRQSRKLNAEKSAAA